MISLARFTLFLFAFFTIAQVIVRNDTKNSKAQIYHHSNDAYNHWLWYIEDNQLLKLKVENPLSTLTGDSGNAAGSFTFVQNILIYTNNGDEITYTIRSGDTFRGTQLITDNPSNVMRLRFELSSTKRTLPYNRNKILFGCIIILLSTNILYSSSFYRMRTWFSFAQ